MTKMTSWTVDKVYWDGLAPEQRDKILLTLGCVVVTEKAPWLEDFSNTFPGFLLAVVAVVGLLMGVGVLTATLL